MYKRIIILLAAILTITSGMENRVYAVQKHKQYIIAQDGTGDFSTIQDGVDAASNGDTIIIYPGIYIEDVQVMNKQINITGVNRDLCILQYDTSSYRKVPLTISAGSVSNLTIYGINSGIKQPELTTEEIEQINSELEGDSWERQKNYRGYAVHIDQNYLFNKSISFMNCRIVSDNNHSVGIGTRKNSTISFENCEIVSTGQGSCIFIHDPTSAGVSGHASLIVKGCHMTSYMCPYVMTLQSLRSSDNMLSLTFQNVRVSAVAYAAGDGYVPYNVNTGFDVETLMALEKAGALYTSGLSSSAAKLVHEMSIEDATDYMDKLAKTLEIGNATAIMLSPLPEGITYIGDFATDSEKNDNKEKQNKDNAAKHQVIAIYNMGNQPGNGWCGLDSAFLTQDSFGNTLVEMNSVINSQNTEAFALP